MRIGMNALSVKTGGGVSAFINLTPAIAQFDKKNEYVIFVSNRQKELLRHIPVSFEKVIIRWAPANPYLRVLWEQIILPFYLLYYRITLLYSVGNITSILAPCKVVLLIENCNPYSNLNLAWSKSDLVRNAFLRILTRLSVKRAKKIRFVSDNSKNLIVNLFKIPKEKCITIYHGFQKQKTNRRIFEKYKSLLENNYILSVAAVAPHKNLERLVAAFDLLINQHQYPGKLIIVGNLEFRDYVQKFCLKLAGMHLEKRVVLTGSVKHSEIGIFYENADAFVLPSIEETFGLPVIEAMGHDLPVAVSDSSQSPLYDNYFIPFREICTNAALYFNPFDPQSIADGMHKLIFDSQHRDKLISNGRRQVKRYNWDKTAKALISVFEQAGGH